MNERRVTDVRAFSARARQEGEHPQRRAGRAARRSRVPSHRNLGRRPTGGAPDRRGRLRSRGGRTDLAVPLPPRHRGMALRDRRRAGASRARGGADPDAGRSRLLPVRASRSPHRERTGSVRDLLDGSRRRAVDERLSRLGQGQRPGRNPPSKSAVGYWHAEGTAGPSEPVEVVREPKMSPSQPVVNALALPDTAKLGPMLGADRLDATVAGFDPGEGSDRYHYVYGREEWLLVWPARPLCAAPVRVPSWPAISCASRRAQPALPTDQSRRVDRARAVLVDDGRAGQRLLPRHRRLGDPQRARGRR